MCLDVKQVPFTFSSLPIDDVGCQSSLIIRLCETCHESDVSLFSIEQFTIACMEQNCPPCISLGATIRACVQQYHDVYAEWGLLLQLFTMTGTIVRS
jgi:hypothetical protein